MTQQRQAVREEKESAAKEETRKKAAKEAVRVKKEKPREEAKKGNTQKEKSREAKTVENQVVIKADWQAGEKCGSGTINWTSSTGERSCVVGKVPQTVSIASSVVISGDEGKSVKDENEVKLMLFYI